MPREAAVELAACRNHDPAKLADGRQQPGRIVKHVRQGGAELGGKAHAAIVAQASTYAEGVATLPKGLAAP